MHAVVVYESMYGNTRRIAEAIARGIETVGTAQAIPVSRAKDIHPGGYDLILVGGPTHVHGMSRESTRHAAEETAAASDGLLIIDPDFASSGVREWLNGLSVTTGRAAAFDTRLDAAPLFTGRASKAISKLLRAAGFELVTEPESFLVDKATRLLPGEAARAEAWGAHVAASIDHGEPSR
jgi:hypothetical protein